MPNYDFRTARLYVEASLTTGATVTLNAAQSNYLRNVLRLKEGDAVLVFNGQQGEWRATVAAPGKRALALEVTALAREQTGAADLHYLFAPLKHARLDYMAQKAVEMGASRLQPVITRHVQVARVNLTRLRANAIEAAEQCGILTMPEISEARPLAEVIAEREPERILVFCDESAETHDPVMALRQAQEANGRLRPALAVLVGPEGGFAAEERALLLNLPNTVRLALGPRILRADTAAVAALALVGAVLGDWR